MKTPSIDSFYQKIDKNILLAQAYTEIDALSFIIKSCRLKPYSYIFEEKQNKIILYKWWFDEFGNSLKILDNKKIKVIYNDLHLNRDKITCTDLYANLKISKIAKISKLAFICTGKDEDLYQNSYMINFLGIDNYWRSYLYFYGEWSQVSPLLLKMDIFELIFKKQDLKYFIEYNNKKNMPMPCISSTQWLTSLPMNIDLLQILKKEHDVLVSVLYSKDILNNE